MSRRVSARIPGRIATAIRDQDARVPGLLFSAVLVADRPKNRGFHQIRGGSATRGWSPTREEPDAPADAPTPWCRRYHPGDGHSRAPRARTFSFPDPRPVEGQKPQPGSGKSQT
jgi:hypothetical protein